MRVRIYWTGLAAAMMIALGLISCAKLDSHTDTDYGAPRIDSGSLHEECLNWCETREINGEGAGWCSLGGPCQDLCEGLLQSEPVESLQKCIEDRPLCFTTLGACINSEIAEEGRESCESWCRYRELEHDDEGFCEPIRHHVRGCVPVCMAALADGFSQTSSEACIQDEPLCFIELGACVENLSENH